MLWLVLLGVGIGGFGAAGYLDLKTTEFPDYLPYAMITAAVGIRALFAYLTSNLQFLTSSLIYGPLFLGFGFLLYLLKQWGDGDAWLLGALGFLFPDSAGLHISTLLPFPLTLLFNFFFLSFFYLIIYSAVLGFKHGVGKGFLKEFKGDAKTVGIVVVSFTVLCGILISYLHYTLSIPLHLLWPLFIFPPFLLGVMVFIHYGRYIENEVFRKKIPVDELKNGDVPADEKWKVLSKKEIKKLKKKGGHIWIKEGVRFAPVFLMTIILTLLYGGLFF